MKRTVTTILVVLLYSAIPMAVMRPCAAASLENSTTSLASATSARPKRKQPSRSCCGRPESLFIGSRTARRTKAGPVSGGKRDLNDAGTHIPLIVRRPGTVPAGAAVDDLVDMADWFPTICNLAGIRVPEDIEKDGVSFASCLQGGKQSPRQWVTGGIGNEVSLFDGNWRIRSGSDRVIDARSLPGETVLESVPGDASQAVRRLRKIVACQRKHKQ